MGQDKIELEQGYCIVCEQQVSNLVKGTNVCEECCIRKDEDFINDDRFVGEQDE